MDTSLENDARWSVMEGTVIVPEETSLRKMNNCRGLIIKKGIHNYTRSKVTICERLGFSYDLEPVIGDHGEHDGCVVVRFDFTSSAEVANNIYNQLKGEKNPVSKLLHESMVKYRRDTTLGQQEWFLLVVYSEEDLENKGGVVYCNKADVVISLEGDREPPPHPADHWTQSWLDVSKDGGLGLKIVNVDNDGVYGDRYLNYNGTVIKIPAIKCVGRDTGIYMYKNIAAIDKLSKNPTKHLACYSHEECADVNSDCPLELFSTGSEAVNNGDIAKRLELKHKELERIHKQQIMILEKEREELKSERAREESRIAEMKKELEQEKIVSDRQRGVEEEAERRLKEAARIQEELLEKEKREVEYRRNMESMRQKDYYENRSYVRKDSSDLMKYIPSVITGIVALFAAFKLK